MRTWDRSWYFPSSSFTFCYRLFSRWVSTQKASWPTWWFLSTGSRALNGNDRNGQFMTWLSVHTNTYQVPGTWYLAHGGRKKQAYIISISVCRSSITPPKTYWYIEGTGNPGRVDNWTFLVHEKVFPSPNAIFMVICTTRLFKRFSDTVRVSTRYSFSRMACVSAKNKMLVVFPVTLQ